MICIICENGIRSLPSKTCITYTKNEIQTNMFSCYELRTGGKYNRNYIVPLIENNSGVSILEYCRTRHMIDRLQDTKYGKRTHQ